MTLKTILSGAPVLLLQQNGGVWLNSTFFFRAELPEFNLFDIRWSGVAKQGEEQSQTPPNSELISSNSDRAEQH
jgi:hypothetical protein